MVKRISSSVMLAPVGEDVVILDTRQGKYFSCNRLGREIFEALQAGQLPSDIVKNIVEDYSVVAEAAEQDVQSFIADLTQSGLYA